MGLHSVMDHLKWQTQRQAKKEEGEGVEGGVEKPIQIETPQSVSFNKSSKRKAERARKRIEWRISVWGECIACSYREAVSADTPLTFHTHTHNDKNSSPSGHCSVLPSPPLPHLLPLCHCQYIKTCVQRPLQWHIFHHLLTLQQQQQQQQQ